MADMEAPYYLQPVTNSEAQTWLLNLQRADRAIMSDLGFFGLLTGGLVQQHGVGNTTFDVSAGGGYDQFGQRTFLPTLTNQDATHDSNGGSTVVAGSGNERWIMVTLQFARLLQDQRTDGNGVTIFYSQPETAVLVITAGAEAAIGSAVKPGLLTNGICLADIKIHYNGGTLLSNILTADIDFTRTQNALPTGALNTNFLGHISGTFGRHTGAMIDMSSLPAWADGTTNPSGTLQVQLAAAINALNPQTSPSGAKKIGFPTAMSGSHYSIGSSLSFSAPVHVEGAIQQLLAFINDAYASFGAASGVTTTALAAWLGGSTASNPGTTVQAQLAKIVTDLINTTSGNAGALKIGAASPGGTHLSAGSIQAALNYIDTTVPWTDTANTWTKQQSSNPAVAGTPSWAYTRTPTLTWEKITEDNTAAAGGGKLRRFTSANGDEIWTLNADWNNGAGTWGKDNTSNPAVKFHLFGIGKAQLAQVPAGTNNFADGVWTSSPGSYVEMVANASGAGMSLTPGGPQGDGPATGHWEMAFANTFNGGAACGIQVWVPFKFKLNNATPTVSFTSGPTVTSTGTGGSITTAVSDQNAHGFLFDMVVTPPSSAGIVKVVFDYSAQ